MGKQEGERKVKKVKVGGEEKKEESESRRGENRKDSESFALLSLKE